MLENSSTVLRTSKEASDMAMVAEEDENLLSGTVHRQVIVVIKRKDYKALPDHLKMAISLSWDRLSMGRTVQMLSYRNQVIFLMTIDPTARQVGSIIHENALNEALADAGDVGRVSVDRYELKLAHKLMSQYGRLC
jgi:hypothetical protein